MNKNKGILLSIFLLCLVLRLYFAFQNPYFDYGEAYLNLGRIEHTSQTGLPLIVDSLSYGGIQAVYLPLFHYILAFFSFFIPVVLVGKIIPNVMGASIVFVIYAITKKITKNDVASLFAAFASIFIPVFMADTVNSISINTLSVPLIFLCIYFLRDLRYINYFIVAFLLLVFTSSSVMFLIIAFLLYLILLKSAGLSESKHTIELVVFSTFFALWLNLLIFRKGLIQQGYHLIWQNIPTSLLSNFFMNFNLLDAILKIGLLPLFLGIFVIYSQVFTEKNKDIYLITGLCFSSLLLLWAKLISLSLGLSILGFSLAILFGVFMHKMLDYVIKTKLSKMKSVLVSIVLILFILTSVIPTYFYMQDNNIPSDSLIQSMVWLRENTEQVKILGILNEGSLITSIAKKKNVFDSNFMFVKNPQQYLNDAKTIYTTPYITDAIRLLDTYQVDYVLLSEETKKQYNIDFPPSFSKNCFKEVYISGVSIYEVKCKVVEN